MQKRYKTSFSEAHLALQRSFTPSWRLEQAKNQENSVLTGWHDASAMFFCTEQSGTGRRIVTLSDVSAEGRFKNMAGLRDCK